MPQPSTEELESKIGLRHVQGNIFSRFTEGAAYHPYTNFGDLKMIAHVCNDRGGWGAGFTGPLGNRYPMAKSYYGFWAKDHPINDWYATTPRVKFTNSLGTTQFVRADNSICVANMVAQHGYKSHKNPTPLSYQALLECLEDVIFEAHSYGASIHMPRIGCELGGGKWPSVVQTMTTAFDRLDIPPDEVDIVVYTLVAKIQH